MPMDMNEAMMAQHHAEMAMYDSMLSHLFQCVSQVYGEKALSNYQMCMHHGGNCMSQVAGVSTQDNMQGPMPQAVSPAAEQPMMPGTCPMMQQMMQGQGM